MHADEFYIDESLVRRLLAAQLPEWANLALVAVPSAGTDNALYRLGDDMVVRLPRMNGLEGAIEKERRWLPLLAPRLPLAIPVPLATGAPAENYPWHWSVYSWLDGETPPTNAASDADHLTEDLIHFVRALQHVDLPDGPPSRRGGPLEAQDPEARGALEDLSALIDTDAATAAWDEALDTPAWSDSPVWVHGDLLPGNLLVKRGHLSGVIDWALMGTGDPACDMVVAWALLPPRARAAFRRELDIDDRTWARGRGWALSIGLIALPYYKATNPEFARTAQHLINEALADYKLRH